jgi:hypothetical protein
MTPSTYKDVGMGLCSILVYVGKHVLVSINISPTSSSIFPLSGQAHTDYAAEYASTYAIVCAIIHVSHFSS